MTQKYIQRLHADFKKYSNQMGISSEDMPQLVTNRYDMRNLIIEKTGDIRFAKRMYYKHKGKAGFYDHELKIIYINTHQRYLYGTTRPLRYRAFLNGLIHELVHCRFNSELQHGIEFDRRVSEILQGKTFSQL